MYNDCSPEIREFLFYLETVKGRSKNTVYAYYKDIRYFFRFIKLHKGLCDKQTDFENISIEDVSIDLIKSVTLSDIYEFFHYVNSTNQSSTIARKASCLRTFYKHMYNINAIDKNPTENLELPKIKKSLPKYLNLEQCLQLLNSIDGPFKARDYCMVTLFLNCGMRLSELVGINLNDISICENNNRLLLRGKGNKERIVYLNDACLSALNDYLIFKRDHYQNAKHLDKKALFLSRNGNRICARQVERIIDNCLQKAGLSGMGFSTHKLRHTAATMMYQHAGVDIRVLQEILGHNNLGTTQIYTHISNSQVKEAIENSPLNFKSKK